MNFRAKSFINNRTTSAERSMAPLDTKDFANHNENVQSNAVWSWEDSLKWKVANTYRGSGGVRESGGVSSAR
jgi:hypothetical protein